MFRNATRIHSNRLSAWWTPWNRRETSWIAFCKVRVVPKFCQVLANSDLRIRMTKERTLTRTKKLKRAMKGSDAMFNTFVAVVTTVGTYDVSQDSFFTHSFDVPMRWLGTRTRPKLSHQPHLSACIASPTFLGCSERSNISLLRVYHLDADYRISQNPWFNQVFNEL